MHRSGDSAVVCNFRWFASNQNQQIRSQMRQLIILTYVFAAISCHRMEVSNELETSGLFKGPSLTLTESVAFEKEIGSRDISYDHFVGIGEGLYPNKNHYILTSVKSFLRTQDPNGNYSIHYWSSADDSVRTVLYEWTSQIPLTYHNDTMDISPSHSEIKIRKLDQTFSKLETKLISLLGSPTLKEIHPLISIETQRDDIKWEYSNKINVYLLMFKHSGYREIRMVTYRH